MENKDNNPPRWTTIAIGVAVIAIVAGLYLAFTREKVDLRQEEINRQKAELDRLRSSSKPLTEKEIATQQQELEQLRKNAKPLSEEELNKQKEELNKLRNN